MEIGCFGNWPTFQTSSVDPLVARKSELHISLMRKIAAVIVGIIGTLPTLAFAEPYYDCAYDDIRVGVGVHKPDRVRLDFDGYSFDAPATIERTRSMVLVSFGFADGGQAQSLMLVANLDGAVTLERSGGALGGGQTRAWACEVVR